MAAAEPIRSKHSVKKMANYWLMRGNMRNYLLTVLGVHTALRISDLLKLRICDVYDFQAGSFKSHVRVIEGKTQKIRLIALNKQSIKTLCRCFANIGDLEAEQFLFKSNRKGGAAISRVQAYRIIRTAAQAVELSGTISCHSLRKTFGYHAWQEGAPVAVIMDIYNHTSFEVTRRYLGVSQDDRDKVYMAMSF